MSLTVPTEVQNDDDRERARQLSLQGSDPPAEIDGYVVVRRLGTGAYGTVWLAREEHTGRLVAIKYYPHRRGLNWSLLNREVEKLATLYASRNIVRLLDVGWNAEPPYYVMEFVENGSLGSYLAGGPLGTEETVRITQQVCGALIEAHGAGVLHCDLKPDNVLLDAQFQVRLCDFGQSRMSHEQSPALGTLYYMAPEQADLEAIPDARWDVYAVGALMYHMLTGQPPYRDANIQRRLESAESLQERLLLYQQHIRTSPPPEQHRTVKGMDRQLASTIDMCLATRPQDRLPNAQAILNQLALRQRYRSRRPLLLLGVLGPILLISALLPIFLGALRKNVHEMERQLITGVQQSNQLTARSHANSLQKELQTRLRAIEAVVSRADIVASLTELMQRPASEVVAQMVQFHDQPMHQRPDWMQMLDRAREAEDRWNLENGRSRDTSWFLTDAAGNQLWRRDFDPEIIGSNYAWRDYFHGGDIQYEKNGVPHNIRPIRKPHVSLAFISEGTKRYMVALSVPVHSAEGEVIGVFARTLHLGDLQEDLGQNIQGKDETRVIALADRRECVLLDHPWLTDELFRDRSTTEANRMMRELSLSEDTLHEVQSAIQTTEQDSADNKLVDIQISSYTDPVSRQTAPSAQKYAEDYIAAISTITDDRMPWLVIVQQERRAALMPVVEMQARATRLVWYAVTASIAIMVAIWLFVWNALSREKQPERARERQPPVPGT